MSMIDDVQTRIKQLEEQLALERARLLTIRDEIPAEFQSMTADVYAKIKAIFETGA